MSERHSEKIAARTVDIAALDRGKVGLDPKGVAAITNRARSQGTCKTHGRAEIAARHWCNLMQTGGSKAALQHGIDRTNADGERPRSDPEIGFLPFDFRHSLPETTQGGSRSSDCHAIIVPVLFY